MPIEVIVEQFPYTINVPGYGTLKATRSSRKSIDPVTAFESAFKQGLSLQSLADSIIVRYAFEKKYFKDGNDIDHSATPQLSRTVQIIVKEKKGWTCYVTELPPTDERSLKLVRLGSSTVRNKHKVKYKKEYMPSYKNECKYILRDNGPSQQGWKEFGQFFMPRSNVFITELINAAIHERRVTSPLKESNLLALSVKEKKGGGSEYSQNEKVVALVGNPVIAELNAEYLRALFKHYQERWKGVMSFDGYVYDLTEEELETIWGAIDIPKGSVMCRLVNLGGTGVSHLEYIYASELFDCSVGFARGIVHKPYNQ